MLDILPTAPVYHIGMYREKSSLLPVQYYNKLPRTCTPNRTLVLEPLIATAGTINAVLEILIEEWGCADVTIISAVASKQGLKQLYERHPRVKVFCAAIDESLTDSGIILPGLGDSGERLNNSQPKANLEPPTPKRLKLN
jgi:uracil phosphoribosyltransferase